MIKITTWILVRQEVHTLGIGTGNARASRTGPGPNTPYHCPTSCRTNIHFVKIKTQVITAQQRMKGFSRVVTGQSGEAENSVT